VDTRVTPTEGGTRGTQRSFFELTRATSQKPSFAALSVLNLQLRKIGGGDGAENADLVEAV
jgi:hypothetical protein